MEQFLMNVLEFLVEHVLWAIFFMFLGVFIAYCNWLLIPKSWKKRVSIQNIGRMFKSRKKQVGVKTKK